MEINSIPISSINAETFKSSCDFMYRLPRPLHNVTKITLVGGDLPNTTKNTLYYDIIESTSKWVNLYGGKKVCGIFRYDIPTLNNRIVLNRLSSINTTSLVNLNRLSTITIRIYDIQSNLHSFGLDYLNIFSITPGNPTVIRTTVNHGLLNGDIIHIDGINNMSTSGKNSTINSTWVITVVSANEFSIVYDTTTEAANQTFTEYGQTYRFGKNAILELGTVSGNYPIYTINPIGLDTVIQLYTGNIVHTNQNIQITGMDNGVLSSDNNKINSKYKIKSIIDPYKFVIPTQLSAYPITNVKTNDPPPFTLGINGNIMVDKYRLTLDFIIESTGRIKRYTEKMIHPGPTSVRKAQKAYYVN